MILNSAAYFSSVVDQGGFRGMRKIVTDVGKQIGKAKISLKKKVSAGKSFINGLGPRAKKALLQQLAKETEFLKSIPRSAHSRMCKKLRCV